MICQSCNKNNATTHIKTVTNGELKEYVLCNDCAEKFGYTTPIGLFEFGLENFLGSVFGNEVSKNKTLDSEKTYKCKQCGTSFKEISKKGKVGCAECYEMFKNELLPLIERIHGNTTHVGKIPTSAGEIVKLKNGIKNFKKQLKEAINKQAFEKAAEIRDQIKEMERQVLKNE